MVKRLVIVCLIICMIILMAGCSKKDKQNVSQPTQQANCVTRENQVVDPEFCRQLETEASSHRDDTNWLSQFLLYHWIFGGSRQGNSYFGGTSYQVFEPTPRYVQPISQDTYVQDSRRITGTAPTTVAPRPRPTTAPTSPPATSAPKTTSAPKSSSGSSSSKSSGSKPKSSSGSSRSSSRSK